jgi:hypothetical protein
MYRIRNKNIYLNRGDKITIRLANNSDVFKIGDYLTFYICEEGNYSHVVLNKRFDIDTETDVIDIHLSAEETRLGEALKTGSRTYWYEIELNGDTTLVGYDSDGPKLFILYPEAIISEEGGDN